MTAPAGAVTGPDSRELLPQTTSGVEGGPPDDVATAAKVKSPVETAVPPAVETEMVRVAAGACGFVVALMVVALVTVKPEVVVVPNLTDVVPRKPVPVTVTGALTRWSGREPV